MELKEYRVTAPVPVFGHSPGVTFKDELDEATEKRNLDRGSLEIVKTGLTPDPPAGEVVSEGTEPADEEEPEGKSPTGGKDK